MFRFIRRFAYLYVILFLVLAFQNCGQVQIQLAPPVELSSQAALSMMAEGCVNSKKIQSEKTKFVFVVDLSRSNIGEFYQQVANGPYYFDKNLGTDPNANRYKVIKDFINTCGNSTNADYSLIAFSKGAGEVVQSGAGKVLQCKNSFVNSAQIISQIENLETIQQEEAVFFNQFTPANNRPYSNQYLNQLLLKVHGETDYVAATDCITSTIEANLTQPTDDSSNYQVFFLSDGEASSTTLNCDQKSGEEKIKCYIDKMDAKLNYLMKLSAAKSKPIRIHSLYYTRDGETSLKIETYMKYLSGIGQTSAPINLGTFNTTTGQTGANPFCELLAVDKSIVYRTSKIYAVNTNYIKMGKDFKIDSDADGILDEDEALYGTDKFNPRSAVNGVLDGVCKIIGTKTQCQDRKQQITCNPTLINQFNISDCDIKMLNLAQSAAQPELVGIDTDNDGVPDYIEILKGLSPINNDSYLDYDVDGMSNLQEISMGLDPYSPDTKEDAVLLSNSTFKDQINQCTSGGWSIEINKIGGIENSPNNLMFFFRVESKNTPGLFEYRVHNTTYDLNRLEDLSLKASFNDLFIDVTQFQAVTP